MQTKSPPLHLSQTSGGRLLSKFQRNDKSRNSEWNRKDNRHRQGCGCYRNRNYSAKTKDAKI